HDVRHGHLVNVAPLQFAEESLRIYPVILCHTASSSDVDYRATAPARIYFTSVIFTILPFACGSSGSFTTVTYNSSSFFPKATLVVPSPAAISKTWRSLPSGDSFKILPPNHWATYMLPLPSIFMLSGPSH